MTLAVELGSMKDPVIIKTVYNRERNTDNRHDT